jgi:hypothetical protein
MARGSRTGCFGGINPELPARKQNPVVLRHIGLRTFQTQKPFEDTAATRNQNAQKAFHDAEGLSQPHNGPVKALR